MLYSNKEKKWKFRGGTIMIKKIMAVLMTFVLSMSLVGCSNDSSDKKTTPKKTTTSSSIKIKDVSDFQEFDGMIKYFTRWCCLMFTFWW